MRQELAAALRAIKPAWFDCDRPRVPSAYPAVGDGWYQLLRDLLEYARWRDEELYRIRGTPNPFDGFRIGQIKEKFGRLRFAYLGGDPEFRGAVEFARLLSGSICEVCGLPGEERDDGWVHTLCDKHWALRRDARRDSKTIES